MKAIVKKTDFYLACLLLIAGIYMLIETTGFDALSIAYPMFLSFIIIILSLLILFSLFLDKTKEYQNILDFWHESRATFYLISIYFLWGILLLIGFGYILASIITTISTLFLLGYQKKHMAVLTGAIIVGVIYILFSIIFDIPFPANIMLERYMEGI